MAKNEKDTRVQVPVKTNGTQVSAGAKQRNWRRIGLIAVIALACAMILTGCILLAVNNARTPGEYRFADLQKQQIASVEAYNEGHRTKYLCSDLKETAAYTYSDGKFDIVIEQRFNHPDGQEAVLYIQTDARDYVTNLRTYYDLSGSKMTHTRHDGKKIDVTSAFDENGIFTASFAFDGCFYCIRFDSGYDNEDDAYRSCMTVVLSVLDENPDA